MIIINPGSENKGGTIEQARINAFHWLKCIHDDGFTDVEMDEGFLCADLDYEFKFTHKVTGKVAVLHTNGFTREQKEAFMFTPREYWNGCSSSNPEIKDWLPEGWNFKIVYYKDGEDD